MACDRNRARYFGSLAVKVAPLVGEVGEGFQLLDTLYDVARNREPPTDAAALRLAEARTRQMILMADAAGVALYPHGKPGALPDAAMQQGWQAVAELLDAVEKGRPLAPLAEEAQGSIALQRLMGFPSSAWSAPMRGVVRQALREAWAADIERVRALVAAPEALGDERHAAWLATLTGWLVDDPEIPAHLRAGARQYLALHEAEMLEPAQRATWAQVLGAAVGVGDATPYRVNCQTCGARVPLGYLQCGDCDPTGVARRANLAAAVARALSDPINAASCPIASMDVMAEQMLGPWMRHGGALDPTSPESQILAALRADDRQMIAMLNGDGRRPIRLADISIAALRSATLRAPIWFQGEACVWDNGRLYPVETFRRLAAMDRLHEGKSCVPDADGIAHVVGEIDAHHMVALMAGREIRPQNLRFLPARIAAMYQTHSARRQRVPHEAMVTYPCGCLYLCDRSGGGFGRLKRINGPRHGPGCLHPDTIVIQATDSEMVQVVNVKKPVFTMPTWPAATGEPPQSSPPEAP